MFNFQQVIPAMAGYELTLICMVTDVWFSTQTLLTLTEPPDDIISITVYFYKITLSNLHVSIKPCQGYVAPFL